MIQKVFTTDENELRCFHNYRGLCQIEICEIDSPEYRFIELDEHEVSELIKELTSIKKSIKSKLE